MMSVFSTSFDCFFPVSLSGSITLDIRIKDHPLTWKLEEDLLGRGPMEEDMIRESNGGHRLDILIVYTHEIEWNILEWIIIHE